MQIQFFVLFIILFSQTGLIVMTLYLIILFSQTGLIMMTNKTKNWIYIRLATFIYSPNPNNVLDQTDLSLRAQR